MFTIRSLLTKNTRALSLCMKYSKLSTSIFKRSFSSAEVQEVKDHILENLSEEQRIINACKKFGADLSFNERKHGYILSFPWNFDEVIQNYENNFNPLKKGNFWNRWIFNRECDRDFNELFRVFHQACAIPEEEGIDRVCEPRLAKYIKRSVENIRFHGMSIEMANLTVIQPKIEILNVEIHHGLSMDRSENKSENAYNITESTLFGAPLKHYTNINGDDRSVLDFFNSNYKPYLVSVTTLIHSPMKLYVWNQNKSKVLFGSDDSESVKNVVKFETNVRWTEFFKQLPVANKPLLRSWKITDYNNVLNENPYF